ncbi:MULTISPECIES: alpha/beta hydrolase [unclassified Streptomyces]|uniref:alpha/beta hydrolase n=1 Tax=unclassified Streptomyces TaxID=2593676 RepID=UPI002255BB1B|nr:MULTISPECIES: alpha/beta hydrolase [unclassified Streptomyces]MCX4987833.1 alpha/beta hydrolase [Streptomyces sp. NBC_00568]MCX5007034.1 alpha/beta hydrolase [Streptomyces sp. NBC_00638]
MRAAVLHGTAGSLLLTGLVAAPAGGAPAWPAPAGSAEARGTAVAAQRAAAAGVRFGKCAKEERLPGNLQCGTVTVPLDYALPDGKRIKLTVSRVKATGKDPHNSKHKVPRQGALVYNPGGPGASGMYFPLIGFLPEWKPIGAAYDLVGYAPRGVDRSAPLSCRDPRRLLKAPLHSPTFPSESYKKERIAEAKAYARGCALRSGPGLRHYTSLNNARDLDVLRAALGERKLTFMGASYGTYFGSLYATLFPSHVRRMVFDSAVNPDPEKIWYRNNLDQSSAFEVRWADFRAWMARHDKVYGLGRTPEEVLRSYEKARAQLAAKPAGGKVGPAQLQGAFLQAGYYDDYWPQRALALSAYLKGDPKPLVQVAGPHPEAAAEQENGSAVYTAVECNDASWPTDWRIWDRDNTRLAEVAPFETWDNVWLNLPCAYWSGPRQRPLDVRTLPGELPPTLILAAERDAATPYEGAKELQRRLWGSVLVTENGAGTHGIGGGPNKCVNGYLNAYLLEGRLPERSAACAPHAEPKPQAPDRRARGTEGAKESKGAAASKASARVATAKTVRQAP